MERREALAALMALPAATRITSVPADSNDVIVVECAEYILDEQKARLRDQLQQVWPNRKIVILGKSLTLKLMAP